MDLAITDLRNGSSAGGLHLSIADLGGLASVAARGARDTGLAIGTLGRGASRDRSTTANDVDVDLRALGGLGLVVQVVEIAAQALVEDGVVTDGEGVVRADGPASSVDGTGLRGTVELELVVGRDVTGAALVVLEDTVLEGDLEVGALGCCQYRCFDVTSTCPILRYPS